LVHGSSEPLQDRFIEDGSRKLWKYKLYLVRVQEVRREKGGTDQVEDYTCFYGEGNEDHQLWTSFFVHKRITSAVRGVEFVSDRCHI
jgi:hypothetical protein